MPATPSTSDNINFIRGLSDFWARFFEDTAGIEAFYDAAQAQLGQLYLELMETTLGTSLQYMPLFDRRYWHLLTVREDRLRFVEGAAPTDDRYAFTPDEPLVDARYFVNRITDPTVVLERGTDFTLSGGQVLFRDLDPNTTATYGFASRDLTLSADADLTHPLMFQWKDLGVKPGDTLRVRFQSGTPVETLITLVQDTRLVLATATEAWKNNLLDQPATRLITYEVFRTPYDHARRGVPIADRSTSIRRFGLFRVTTNGEGIVGLTDAEVDLKATEISTPGTLQMITTNSAWAGKWIAVRDDSQPSNDGIYEIASVTSDSVQVVSGLTVLSSGPFTVFVGNAPMAGDAGSSFFLNDSVHPENDRGFVHVDYVNIDEAHSIHFGPLGLVDSTTFLPIQQVTFRTGRDNKAIYKLPDEHIDTGSVVVLGRRLFDKYFRGVTYPAGGALVETVDYDVDYVNGYLHLSSVWEQSATTRVDYDYRLRITALAVSYRSTWNSGTSYDVYDEVRSSGKSWIATAASTGVTPAPGPYWQEYTAPFTFDRPTQIRELSIWVPDALIDKDRLYTNFGYLLTFKKPSTENYRTFLRGVSQLFLLGPSLSRMESAFNIMAGLPVAREDGEVLTGFSSAYAVLSAPDDRLGTRGEIVESAYGNSGLLSSVTGRFSVADDSYQGAWSTLLSYAPGLVTTYLNVRWRALVDTTLGSFIDSEWAELPPLFYPTDVGGIITLQRADGDVFDVSVSSVTADGFSAKVFPLPVADEDSLLWQFSHVAIRRRFSVKGAGVTRSFTQEDVGAYLIIESAREARNRGVFRIESVEGPRVVYLNATHTFVDEGNLTFRLSSTLTHSVTTTKHAYTVPINAQIREDLSDPNNFGALTLNAFEVLTEAVVIEDYVRNDAWWHTVTIPPEILEDARRQVSPQLVEHVVGAMDKSAAGDLGLVVGRDDEGLPGIERPCTGLWLGDGWVRLTLPAGVNLRVRDVGQYLSVGDVAFQGEYEIVQVLNDNLTVQLRNFPPREAGGIGAPHSLLLTTLPPILYRRTVSFVLMDRLLKYHALRIRINAPELFTTDFVNDALALLKESKPSGSFVYLEPATTFAEVISLRETFELTYGPWVEELMTYAPLPLLSGTDVRVGEFFAFFDQHLTVVLSAGANTYTVTPTLPYTADRTKLMFARFRTGTAAGRPLTEGVNYSVNYETGVITVPSADAATVTLDVIILALRVPSPWLEPWWANAYTGVIGGIQYAETPVHVGGSDPSIRQVSGITQPDGQCIVEPPLQIIVTGP
jgi:hypothetical protein